MMYMTIDRKSTKRMIVYINNSQKQLQTYLENIGFYYYTIQSKLEGSWEFGLRHLNNHIWPGSDCVFHLIVHTSQVDTLLKN